LLIGLLGPFLVGSTAQSGPAESACTLHPQHARLEVTVVGYPNVLKRSGDDLLLNGSSCDGATVHNTDLVDVTAQLGRQVFSTLRIGMIDGLFSPGATVGSEIPIHVDFTQTPSATLDISTGAGAQHIEIDGNDVDLDADDDAPQPDIIVSDPAFCGPDCTLSTNVSTGPGPDHIIERHPDEASFSFISSGGGDDVVHVQESLVISGTGNDLLESHQGATLFGQGGADVLIGGAGDDDLYGGDSKDRIFGRGGQDEIFGGDGRDIVVGGRGNDRALGEDDGDRIWSGRGIDRIHGGDGFDRCELNPGDDLRGTGCEHRLRVPPPAL
jgi:Ca2+-binding RTX toxin-like protein